MGYENTEAGLAQVRKSWQYCLQNSGFDYAMFSNLQIISASEEGEVVFRFKVENIHLNVFSGIHGGYMCSLVDIGGSLAIAAKGMFSAGVSTDLSVSFLSPAAKDDIIIVRSRCDKLGKSMAFTTTELIKRDPKTQVEEIIAKGSHTKFVLSSHQSNGVGKNKL